MILRSLISLRAFAVYMENSLRLEISLRQIDRSEICTEVSFTSPEVMCVLIIKLPYTEVKFLPELKSQTGLSSLSSRNFLTIGLAWSVNAIYVLFWRKNVSVNFILSTRPRIWSFFSWKRFSLFFIFVYLYYICLLVVNCIYTYF